MDCKQGPRFADDCWIDERSLSRGRSLSGSSRSPSPGSENLEEIFKEIRETTWKTGKFLDADTTVRADELRWAPASKLTPAQLYNPRSSTG